MIITGFRRIEATETKPEKGIVKGAIFNFMGALLPVEFSVTHAGAMDYFEAQSKFKQIYYEKDIPSAINVANGCFIVITFIIPSPIYI